MKLQQWANLAEVVASLAIVVTLVVLVFELRANTAAIERDAVLERSSRIQEPFVTSGGLTSIFAKVKAVDGTSAINDAFVDRYDLSVVEAERWIRHLSLIWYSLQADYQYQGPSRSLENTIEALLSARDNQLYWRNARDFAFSEGFTSYVEAVNDDSGS